MNKAAKCLKLFTSTLILSACTFGGGYVIVPLMRKKFSDELGWLKEDDMLELVALAQSSPGAIAINCAVLTGYRVAGLTGALCGLLGTAIPPLIILSVVSVFYELLRDNPYVAVAMTGMQAGIAAVIADAVFGMASGFFHKDKLPSVFLMITAFTAAWYFKVNAALIIAFSAVYGVVTYLMRQRKVDSDS